MSKTKCKKISRFFNESLHSRHRVPSTRNGVTEKRGKTKIAAQLGGRRKMLVNIFLNKSKLYESGKQSSGREFQTEAVRGMKLSQ